MYLKVSVLNFDFFILAVTNAKIAVLFKVDLSNYTFILLSKYVNKAKKMTCEPGVETIIEIKPLPK